MRENRNGTYLDDGNRTCSVCKRAKQGNQRFLEKTKKLHYKRRGWFAKGEQRKKERNTKRKKFPRENYQKICGEEKILREKQILLPGILQKPLLHMLGFNENQTLQVLKAEIVIQDCNF